MYLFRIKEIGKFDIVTEKSNLFFNCGRTTSINQSFIGTVIQVITYQKFFLNILFNLPGW